MRVAQLRAVAVATLVAFCAALAGTGTEMTRRLRSVSGRRIMLQFRSLRRKAKEALTSRCQEPLVTGRSGPVAACSPDTDCDG